MPSIIEVPVIGELCTAAAIVDNDVALAKPGPLLPAQVSDNGQPVPGELLISQ